MKQRNSAIELTRIFFVIGVVFLHYNGNALLYVRSESTNYYWILFTEAISVGAVDFFVMVSGCFLSQNNIRKTIKAVQLLLQAVLFNIAFYLGAVLIGQQSFNLVGLANRIIPENYYVVLYCCLYLISPYINILLNGLDERATKKLLLVSFFLFSVASYISDVLTAYLGSRFVTLNTISANGSSGGCNIASFVLLYIIGACIGRDIFIIRRKKLFLAISIIGGLILALSLLAGIEHSVVAWSYNSPFVVAFVATVIIWVKSHSFESKAVNELSKASYTCYLFHANFLIFLGIEHATQGGLLFLIAHQLAVGVGLYITSYIVFKLYSLCTGWFLKRLYPLCETVDGILAVKEK